jgi:hypothetical protein
MKSTHWVLYIAALPWNLLVAWPIVLLIRLLWGEDLRWERPPAYSEELGGGGGPCLTCSIKAGSWAVTPGRFPKGWYWNKRTKSPWGGTALGHGIFYGPNGRNGAAVWTVTQAHEHVHVEQAEVAMFQSFLVGLGAGTILGILGHWLGAVLTFSILWFLGYALMGVSGWVVALLRGEDPYWGATHEESARAQTRDSME